VRINITTPYRNSVPYLQPPLAGAQASTRGAPRPGGPVGGGGRAGGWFGTPAAIGGLARRDEPRRIGRTQDA